LNKIKDPDLSYVVNATELIANILRKGQLIILESTTYPGTTRELMLPILERKGFEVGVDFNLCFSPERVDPGNEVWHTKNTPKVIGGITENCKNAGINFYEQIFDKVVPVQNTEAAELVKVYENTFRMINIALANELSQICDRLGLDVWDVIDAASTKPFGFMKFTPGPGLGGHCIPLDPHYLSWKMRTLSFKTRMIELASEINADMPANVVEKIGIRLNDFSKSLKGSTVLIIGIAYKKDIDDLRESPALDIIKLLQNNGAIVKYHDLYCPIIADDGHTQIRDLPMNSTPLTIESVKNSDIVAIITNHSNIDYKLIADNAIAFIDTRGIMRNF
jgi:UDP-N-acetyl-D-glucosamine dehydrogenase